MTIDDFKLKHIEAIQSKTVDYVRLLVEVAGYKPSWWNNRAKLPQLMKDMAKMVYELQNLDPKKIEHNSEGCDINYTDVDNMTFIGRLELDNLIDNDTHDNALISISNMIAVATYSDNIDGDFDIDSPRFKRYRQRIENTSAIQMIGLGNKIMDDLENSRNMWNERFESVHVEDTDYDMAGGHRMNQFNVINTVKAICADFNKTYEDAWQMPYVVVQSNSYSKATHTSIMDSMTRLKEKNMRAARKHS